MTTDQENEPLSLSFEIAKPVGRWVLPGSNQYGGVAFDIFYKPRWFHRKMMEILMGWEYQDL